MLFFWDQNHLICNMPINCEIMIFVCKYNCTGLTGSTKIGQAGPEPNNQQILARPALMIRIAAISLDPSIAQLRTGERLWRQWCSYSMAWQGMQSGDSGAGLWRPWWKHSPSLRIKLARRSGISGCKQEPGTEHNQENWHVDQWVTQLRNVP